MSDRNLKDSKKDLGVDLDCLTNADKAAMVTALRKKYKLCELLPVVGMAKSSYEYAANAQMKSESEEHIAAKEAVIAAFRSSGNTYGHRRISAVVDVGEWTVRNIMKQEELVACAAKKKRRYSSYKGVSKKHQTGSWLDNRGTPSCLHAGGERHELCDALYYPHRREVGCRYRVRYRAHQPVLEGRIRISFVAEEYEHRFWGIQEAAHKEWAASLTSADGGLMAETTVRDLLLSEQEMLRAVLAVALGHPVTKGDHTEEAWIHFLQSFLPSKYSVTKGFVFDSQGNKSSQIDVIIYDAHHSPLIYRTDSGETYVTAESVYAVFECKQEVTADYLRYANEKVASVERLHRTSRGMYASGKYQAPRDLPHIIGGLLATRGSVDSKLDVIRSCDNLDICASLSGGTALVTRRNDEEPTVSVSAIDDAIPSLYFALLDSLHRLGTVPAIDIRDYAKLCELSLALPEGD